MRVDAAPAPSANREFRSRNLSAWLARQRESSYGSLALVLSLLAFALRLYLLGDSSVWWDEAISAWTARLGLIDIAYYQAAAVHPPLHYSLLHFWAKAVGESEFALRYFSVACGVLSVAMLYRLGARWISPRTGLLAAALLAVSRFHVWWSQEIRMYALATLLAIVAFEAFLGLMAGHRRWVALVYCIATSLLLYTLYLGVLTLLAQNVAAMFYILWRRAARRERVSFALRWFILQMIVALLYAPWLYMMVRHAGQRTLEDPPLEPALFARIYATVLTLGVDVNVDRYAGIVAAVFIGACLSIVLVRRRPTHRRLIGIAALYVTIPPVAIYLLSLPSTAFYTPATNARYFLLFVPAWFLLLSIAVASWWHHSRWLAAALGVALVLLVAYFTPQYYGDRFRQDDYQTLTATIRSYSQPGDTIVLNPDTDWPVFLYHYRANLPWQGLPHAERMTHGEVDSLLAPVWANHDRVWLVSSVKALAYDPDGNVLTWLRARGQEQLDRDYGEQRLTLFVRQSGASSLPLPLAADARPRSPLAIDVGGGLKLIGYDQWLERVDSGQVVYLTLWWQTVVRPSGAYGLRLALIDGGGRVDAQRRFRSLDDALATTDWVAGQTYRQTYEFPIRSDVQSGRYRWLVELLDLGSRTAPGSVPLGSLGA